MTPLNVLVYEPYPMGKIGGNLRTLAYILGHLDRSRFTPIVVTPAETEFIGRIRARGVECVVAPPPASVDRYAGGCLKDSLAGRVRTMIGLAWYNLRLIPLIRRRRIDVIYCNSIRAVLCAGLAGRLTGRPVLWYIKGHLENPLLDRFGFRLADRILYFCESNRDDRYPDLVRRYSRKIGILKIGIDPAIVEAAERADKRALAAELDITPDHTNAIVLGQLYRPKGVHLVLERLRDVIAACPNLRLYIVGDHVLEEYRAYREDLERIIEREGLQAHVVFTGWRTDAMQILSLMDIVVHPSLAEGFGRAVLEAMALGRPVVASAVGGLREIIKDGRNGFLVEPGNAAMIAERLRALAVNPALREQFGREAKRAVYAEYLIDDKVERLQEIWAEMAGRRVSPVHEAAPVSGAALAGSTRASGDVRDLR